MTDRKYAEELVVLPRAITNEMIVAWFTAEKHDKPISECWDALVAAFEKSHK